MPKTVLTSNSFHINHKRGYQYYSWFFFSSLLLTTKSYSYIVYVSIVAAIIWVVVYLVLHSFDFKFIFLKSIFVGIELHADTVTACCCNGFQSSDFDYLILII
jgi:hypothetical protein